MNKEYLHEQAETMIKDLMTYSRKIIESLEIGDGCQEAECLVINTSTRCFLQTAEELLELIDQIKLRVIMGNRIAGDEDEVKKAQFVADRIKKFLANADTL